MNTEVQRQPVDPAETQQEIDDIFVFRAPISEEHSKSCQKIQEACKDLAKVICAEVPEGKERTIAVNNLLSTALFARHGITRRQVLIGALPPQEPFPEPVPIPIDSPASPPDEPKPME